MNTMNAHNIPILREYVPFNVERLEGKVVQSAKAMYVINNGNIIYHKNIINNINNTNLLGTKRLIPNFDTFNAMNFTLFDVVHFYNFSEFLSIPEGTNLPPLDYP